MKKPTEWEKIFANEAKWQDINLQNTQTLHVAIYKKITIKKWEKIEIDISSKKKYRRPTGTWKDAQHH